MQPLKPYKSILTGMGRHRSVLFGQFELYWLRMSGGDAESEGEREAE